MPTSKWKRKSKIRTSKKKNEIKQLPLDSKNLQVKTDLIKSVLELRPENTTAKEYISKIKKAIKQGKDVHGFAPIMYKMENRLFLLNNPNKNDKELKTLNKSVDFFKSHAKDTSMCQMCLPKSKDDKDEILNISHYDYDDETLHDTLGTISYPNPENPKYDLCYDINAMKHLLSLCGTNTKALHPGYPKYVSTKYLSVSELMHIKQWILSYDLLLKLIKERKCTNEDIQLALGVLQDSKINSVDLAHALVPTLENLVDKSNESIIFNLKDNAKRMWRNVLFHPRSFMILIILARMVKLIVSFFTINTIIRNVDPYILLSASITASVTLTLVPLLTLFNDPLIFVILQILKRLRNVIPESSFINGLLKYLIKVVDTMAGYVGSGSLFSILMIAILSIVKGYSVSEAMKLISPHIANSLFETYSSKIVKVSFVLKKVVESWNTPIGDDYLPFSELNHPITNWSSPLNLYLVFSAFVTQYVYPRLFKNYVEEEETQDEKSNNVSSYLTKLTIAAISLDLILEIIISTIEINSFKFTWLPTQTLYSTLKSISIIGKYTQFLDYDNDNVSLLSSEALDDLNRFL